MMGAPGLTVFVRFSSLHLFLLSVIWPVKGYFFQRVCVGPFSIHNNNLTVEMYLTLVKTEGSFTLLW